MAAQQDLIEAAAIRGLKLHLVWSPVAAALVWCSRFGHVLLTSTAHANRSLGTLAILHLGIDTWDCALLDVIPRECGGTLQLLPARGRLQNRPFLHYGLEQLHNLAAWHLQALGRSPDRASVWRLLWCTPWISDVFRFISGRMPQTLTLPRIGHLWSGIDSTHRQQWVNAFYRQATGSWRHLCRAQEVLPSSSTLKKDSWIADCRDLIGDRSVIGAVATGPMASLGTPSGQMLGSELLHKICQRDHNADILIDGAGGSGDVLSEGAALYGARLFEGLPTYLDTLPRLRTAAYVVGRPSWINLLSETDEFVEGGKAWRRPRAIEGLHVNAGHDSLEITLHHEDYPTVRQVSAQFPSPLSHDLPVRLEVSITPAHGNAQVEVIADKPAVFGGRRVFVEWRKMKPGTDPPDDWLASLPTLFPELLTRGASPINWRPVERSMREYLRSPHDSKLRGIAELLRQKDFTGAGRHQERRTTAISSEGLSPAGDSPVLDEFVRRVSMQVCRDGAGASPWAVRALAYTATGEEAFQNWLGQQLNAPAALPQHVLAGCGWCLRNPIYIAFFGTVLFRLLRDYSSSVNNWLKAFAEMLRYREDATKEMNSALAEELTDEILNVFERERLSGEAKFLFRNSSLCIVYLLRRRAYDDDYLHKDSGIARKVKASFTKAIDAFRRHRLQAIGGTIDLSKVLQTMIDYVDRKGPSILSADGDFADIVD